MGDLLDGVQAGFVVLSQLAVVIATIMVFWYPRCVRSNLFSGIRFYVSGGMAIGYFA